MQLLDQRVIFTPANVSECDFSLVRRVAELRGLIPATPPAQFLGQRRAHLLQEQRAQVAQEYQRKYSLMFTTVDSPPAHSLSELQNSAADTVKLLRGLRVVAGGTLLVETTGQKPASASPVGTHPAPAVPGDTQLTTAPAGAILAATAPIVMAGTAATAVLERFTRAEDLLELGSLAYAAQVATGRAVDAAFAHLNNGRYQEHDGQDLIAVAAPRIAYLGTLLTEANTRPDPWPWGDPLLVACGFCPWCRGAAAEHHDTQLVWGVRRAARNALAADGITTVDALAQATELPELDSFSWSRFHTRALLQSQQDHTGETSAVVHNPAAITALPQPDPGDIFFDFEGDPLWVEKNRYEWGLEFLFGYIQADTGEYTALWSTTQSEEKRAFTTFLDFLRERRAAYPKMHVYHFAFYEQQTLRRLARRHKVGQTDVNNLLDDGIFVDLYETIKSGVHFSGRSYGLKALEPLYMGEDLRTGEVGDGAAAVEAFSAGIAAKKRGRAEEWASVQHQISDYNRYDCLSTQRLRDWLLDQQAADPATAAKELLGGIELQGDLAIAPLEEPTEDLSGITLAAPQFDEPGIFYIASGTSNDAIGAEHKSHELLGRWGSGSAYAVGRDLLVVYADPAASPTDTTSLTARRATLKSCDLIGNQHRIVLRETTPAHDPAIQGLTPAFLTTALPAPEPSRILKAAKRHRYTIVTGPPGSGTSARATELANEISAVIIDDAHGVSLVRALEQIAESEHVVIAGDPARARPTPPRALPADLVESSILSWLLGDSGAKITQRIALDTSTRFHAPLSETLQTFYPAATFAAPSAGTLMLAEEFSGLRLRQVEHHGNRDSSPEEGAEVAAIVARVFNSSPVDPHDVIVTAGSHNQALLLQTLLAPWPGVRVLAPGDLDVADAALVIFSVGTSTFADLPPGHVPFAPHLLANAFSRAREGVILVCSTHLGSQVLPRAEHIPAAAKLLRLLEQ